MSLRSPFSRRACLGGLAVAGLVTGHCLAYRFFGPVDPHAHHHGGHSHLPYVLAIVFGLLVAAVGSIFDSRSKRPGLGGTGVVLLGAQLLGFVGLSVMDKVTGTPGTAVGSRAFWIGLAIQVIVAGLGALVLLAFRKTVEAIDRILRAELPASTETAEDDLPSLTVAIPSLAMATGGPSFRGPPEAR